MKKIILFHVLLLSVFISQAQFSPVTPEFFYKLKVTSPPALGTICNSDEEEKKKYNEKMRILSKEVDEQIAYLKKDEKKNAAAMEQQAKQKMATEYGLSAADMQKMQSGKMTKEEKKAMADKMLQQNYGITVDEAKDVAGYSKAGKEAWAEGYADQQKAEAAKDPKKNQETLEKNKSLYELTQEKDLLSKKLLAKQDKFAEQLREIDADSTAVQLLREIYKLSTEYANMMGVDYGQGNQMEQLAGTIKSKKISYCNMQTDKYLKVLAGYNTSISTDFQDYYRLEELINEVNSKTTGSDVHMMSKGLMSYENIKSYFGLLQGVYKYSIYNAGSPY